MSILPLKGLVKTWTRRKGILHYVEMIRLKYDERIAPFVSKRGRAIVSQISNSLELSHGTDYLKIVEDCKRVFM